MTNDSFYLQKVWFQWKGQKERAKEEKQKKNGQFKEF